MDRVIGMQPWIHQSIGIFDGIQIALLVLSLLLLLAGIVILRSDKRTSPIVGVLLILVQAVVVGTGMGVCWQSAVLVSDYNLTGNVMSTILVLLTGVIGFTGMVISLVQILNWLTRKINR